MGPRPPGTGLSPTSVRHAAAQVGRARADQVVVIDFAPHDYDLIAIGSGPAGQRAAIQAAKLGKRAGVIEAAADVGGVCVQTGTIPSKTFREAALALTGYRDRGFYGTSYRVKDEINVQDLFYRADLVMRNEIDVIRHQLARNGVELIPGRARFLNEHTLAIEAHSGGRTIRAGTIVIATGTRPAPVPGVPFDGRRVLTSDDLLRLEGMPRTLAVIGAGVIGIEYASMFAALGVRVTLIDKRERLLPFIDAEITDALAFHLRRGRMTVWLGEEVSGVEVDAEPEGPVLVHLASGKHVIAEKALFSVGRVGATEDLDLEAAGLTPDERGRLAVDAHYRTSVSSIYAAGDVIGFPSLASTSLEQGRLAACAAFGVPTASVPELIPYAIYTIPEISTVGRSEQELTEAGIPYEVGKAQYREIARGQIIGDQIGLLKLLFHWETHELLGVHIIGEGASELAHIGQAVMAFGGRIEHFVESVFNYPTLAECYKTAALDGLNRLDTWRRQGRVVGADADRAARSETHASFTGA